MNIFVQCLLSIFISQEISSKCRKTPESDTFKIVGKYSSIQTNFNILLGENFVNAKEFEIMADDIKICRY